MYKNAQVTINGVNVTPLVGIDIDDYGMEMHTFEWLESAYDRRVLIQKQFKATLTVKKRYASKNVKEELIHLLSLVSGYSYFNTSTGEVEWNSGTVQADYELSNGFPPIRREQRNLSHSSSETIGDGEKFAIALKCTGTRDIERIVLYGSGSDGNTITFKIYSDSSGSPGSQISGSTSKTGSLSDTVGWQEIDISGIVNNASLSVGQYIWLVGEVSGASITLYGASSYSHYHSKVYSTSWDDSTVAEFTHVATMVTDGGFQMTITIYEDGGGTMVFTVENALVDKGSVPSFENNAIGNVRIPIVSNNFTLQKT